jgi:hypothetical protein
MPTRILQREILSPARHASHIYIYTLYSRSPFAFLVIFTITPCHQNPKAREIVKAPARKASRNGDKLPLDTFLAAIASQKKYDGI